MTARYKVVMWPAMGPHLASYHVWDNETHSELLGRYTAEDAAARVAELNAPTAGEQR